VAAAWSRLYLDLEDYLSPRGPEGKNQLVFSQRSIEDGSPIFCWPMMRERAPCQAGGVLHLPASVAQGWRAPDRQPPEASRVTIPSDARSSLDGLEATLTDIDFIEAMCASRMTFDLVREYRAALDALPEAQDERLERMKAKNN